MSIIGKKDILVLVKGPADVLDDTTVAGEAKYSINFTETKKIFSLNLHYK